MTYPSATQPASLPPFVWASGIEDTFIPQSRPGLRSLDEYALTQHYQLWRSDFDLVADAGVQALRWGIPWYRVQPSPGRWDWQWTDEALDYLINVKKITPILDLMHYGTPDWLENSFINHAYPERVAEYAAAVADRYRSLVRYYTPLNEPMVNAEFCGRRAEWPPYLSGEDGFVKLLLAIARGIVLTTRALKSVQPECVTVQVEALWKNWTTSSAHQEEVALGNHHQYLCFDLTTGRVDELYPVFNFLSRHGVSENQFAWFRAQAVTFDIFGANFYPWSYGELKPQRNGALKRVKQPTPGGAIGEVITAAYRRYQLPLIVTETSANAPLEGRAQWMDETIDAVRRLRLEGLPVVGYTWFPLFTMIDWAYRRGRKPLEHYLLHLGLYDSAYDAQGVLQRQATSLVERYRNHIHRGMPEISQG